MPILDINKTIAYVSVVHPLHDHRFLYKQCSGLVKHGFEVDYYVQHTQPETLQGVHIKPLKTYASRLGRFLSTFGLLPKLLKKKYAAYHLVDPELLPLGILLKLLSRKAVIFDAHEDYVDFMKRKHYLPGFMGTGCSWGIKVMLNASSRLFDGFVFADEGTATMFDRMPQEKKCFFYNFPMRSMFPEKPNEWATRTYELVFLGTMSVTSGTLVILDAIKRLRENFKTLKCLFIGFPGKELHDRVFEFIAQNGLEANVEFTGRLPHSEIPALLQQCKIGLIGLLDLPKFHSNIATKLFEYMASGIPVVSSDLPPERKFIPDDQCGRFFTPGDAEDMAQAISAILSDPKRGAEMSAAARNHMLQQQYFAEAEIRKLADFYGHLLSGHRNIACES